MTWGKGPEGDKAGKTNQQFAKLFPKVGSYIEDLLLFFALVKHSWESLRETG